VAFHEGRGVNLKFSRGVCAQDASQDRDLCDSSIGPLAEDDGMEVRAISGDSRGISIGYTVLYRMMTVAEPNSLLASVPLDRANPLPPCWSAVACARRARRQHAVTSGGEHAARRHVPLSLVYLHLLRYIRPFEYLAVCSVLPMAKSVG
jgi:hypothetical protein